MNPVFIMILAALTQIYLSSAPCSEHTERAPVKLEPNLSQLTSILSTNNFVDKGVFTSRE